MLARCCSPQPPCAITGYFSHDNVMKVHTSDCQELKNVESERLVSLTWAEVLTSEEDFTPEADYRDLDETDFAVLRHHEQYGVDYSLVIARKLNISKQDAFSRHKKLLAMKLIERVEPRIIQYRKGIVEGKWIKHRNHTYYDLTRKGRDYLGYFHLTERTDTD